MGFVCVIGRISKLWMSYFTIIGTGLFLGGCANHNIPLLRDVANLNTSDVVHKIMCEVGDKLQWYTTDVLRPEIGDVSVGLENRAGKKLLQDIISEEITSLKENLDKAKAAYVNALSEQNRIANAIAGNDAELHILNSELLNIENIIGTYGNIVQPNVIITQAGTPDSIVNKYYELLFKEKNILERIKLLKIGQNSADEFVNSKTINFLSSKNALLNYPQNKLLLYDFLANVLDLHFIFHITENNMGGVTFDFAKPVSHGTVSGKMGLGPSSLTRDSKRTVKITANFEELINTNCDAGYQLPGSRANIVYPITGDIGIGHLIAQFLDIREQDEQKSKEDIFSNKIIFTTELKGNIDPKISLTPLTSTNYTIGANFSQGRKDIHELDLVVKRPIDLI